MYLLGSTTSIMSPSRAAASVMPFWRIRSTSRRPRLSSILTLQSAANVARVSDRSRTRSFSPS